MISDKADAKPKPRGSDILSSEEMDIENAEELEAMADWESRKAAQLTGEEAEKSQQRVAELKRRALTTRRAGAGLGRGDEFIHNPDAVLDPATAYAIMSTGMRKGLFTGAKMSDFIDSNRVDYFSVRRIVNPGDAATFQEVAQNAERFEQALAISLR